MNQEDHEEIRASLARDAEDAFVLDSKDLGILRNTSIEEATFFRDLMSPPSIDLSTTRPLISLVLETNNSWLPISGSIRPFKPCHSCILPLRGRGTAKFVVHFEARVASRQYVVRAEEDGDTVDIISRINWLSEHNVSLKYKDRHLKLRKEEVTKIMIESEKLSYTSRIVLPLEAHKLINMGCEELLGLPFNRKLEFGIEDRKIGHPCGFGFVTYVEPSVVDKVIEDTHVINGNQVDIKRTIPKEASGSKDFKTRKIFVGGTPSTVSEDESRTTLHNMEKSENTQSCGIMPPIVPVVLGSSLLKWNKRLMISWRRETRLTLQELRFGNTTYLHISVAFIQMLKALSLSIQLLICGWHHGAAERFYISKLTYPSSTVGVPSGTPKLTTEVHETKLDALTIIFCQKELECPGCFPSMKQG
ncbi:hypothetical protein F3Y22_tig00112957pilonHSYRG00036 [Hibiscus syriacus]|uniref:RRM domain-containing protein n=1 Tax=Hibiscus syriacus TaxID=106335 RepID=A0A6A2WR72_HIBSY|nr:hypothetical protein F3Y22_tig00112957pilonHSYRG00036 [Hibiscus syriacus]